MANGQKGDLITESIIEFSLISLSIAMIIVYIAVLIGLKRNVQ